MPQARAISVQFPLGGLDRTLAFREQPPTTTPLCLNIWPVDVETGRGRGGVRPGLTTDGGDCGGDPYNWCRAPYISSGVLKEAIAVTSSGGTKLTHDGANWTTPPKITALPGTTLASPEVFNGYLFQARGGGTCRVKLLPSGSEGDLAVSFYDPGPDTLPKGTAPENCGIVIRHADRLCLLGDTTNYHVVRFSATNDHTNWDYSDTTEGGAHINSGGEGGLLGNPVYAAIRHNKTILLVGGANAVYAYRGNPRTNGVLVVDDSIGPLGNAAWCKGIDRDGNSNTYMMTYDGLYMIPAGGLQVVKLSKRKVPNELLGLTPTLGADGNNSGKRVAIGFDNRWECIHIAVNNPSGAEINYTYSIPHDSYWPTSYSDTPMLLPTFPQLQTATLSSVLPIVSNGTVYQYDSDSTESFDSYMLLGPIMLGDIDSEGVLHSITAALAANSEDVKWQIYAGDSVEQAYDLASAAASPAFTGRDWSYTSNQYLNNRQHPRVRGHAAYIRIYDDLDNRWLLEDIIARISPAGVRRNR